MLDIKIIAIVSVLILLILGYFVYVLYQDVVFLRKDIQEIKGNDWEFAEDEENDEENDEEEDDEDFQDESEEHYHNNDDEVLESHLNTFLNQPSLPTIVEVQEKEEVLETEDPIPVEIEEKTVKKRKTKSK